MGNLVHLFAPGLLSRLTRATVSAPFSYTCQIYPPDAEDLIEAALGAAQASLKIHGHHFTTGRLCETLYRYAILLLILVRRTKIGSIQFSGERHRLDICL